MFESIYDFHSQDINKSIVIKDTKNVTNVLKKV